MTGQILSVGLFIVLIAGVVLAAMRVRLWRRGASTQVQFWRGLVSLPRRYLVDVHHVVARKRRNARFHAMAAGGFLASIGLILSAGALGTAPRWLWAVASGSLVMTLCGALLDILRRTIRRPPELSRGAFARFPFLIATYAASALTVAADIAAGERLPAVATWICTGIALSAFSLVVHGVSRGPIRHAVAGALHLVVHPRPGRFSDCAENADARPTALAPLDLQQERLGAGTVSDFTWNRLAGFDACVQCGRCEELCPAYDAGLPLNPKAFVQDLVRAMDPAAPAYRGNGHPGLEPGEGGLVDPQTLWACTTCRACVEACPMMIEHVDAMVDLRRFQALEKAAVPGKAPEVLEELRATDNTHGLAAARRVEWATDLSLRVLGEGEDCELLLWLGDAAFDLRGQRTLRALVKQLQEAGADFAILGEAEKDCGDLARRLGDEATFQSLAQQNIALLNARRFGRIVTADPHALHVLRNEYPAFGGRYGVVHHTALLLELAKAGKVSLASLEGRALTYHDPCYLGRYNGEYEAPRRLLELAGATVTEMARSGPQSHCCGGGGGAPQTDIEGEHRIPDRRMEQARATGAGCVAVACPGCAQMLEGVTGPRPDVFDIVELITGSDR